VVANFVQVPNDHDLVEFPPTIVLAEREYGHARCHAGLDSRNGVFPHRRDSPVGELRDVTRCAESVALQ
jgi:hypothetical protein